MIQSNNNQIGKLIFKIDKRTEHTFWLAVGFLQPPHTVLTETNVESTVLTAVVTFSKAFLAVFISETGEIRKQEHMNTLIKSVTIRMCPEKVNI